MAVSGDGNHTRPHGTSSGSEDQIDRIARFLETSCSGGKPTQDEWTWFIDATRPLLLRIACGITLKDTDTVKDVLQEVYLRIFLGKVRYVRQPSATPMSFLVQVLVNQVRKKTKPLKIRALKLESDLPGGALPEGKAGPTSTVTSDEIVEEVLAALPVPLREILVVHYFEAFSMEEIASALGFPSAHSARKELTEARRAFLQIGKQKGYAVPDAGVHSGAMKRAGDAED